MKVLFIGEIGPGQTSLMRMRALERLGHEVKGVHTTRPWVQALWLQRQLQRRLQRGSIIRKINRQVLDATRAFKPDLLWAEKQAYLLPETVCELRKVCGKLVHFTPDPYFYLDWQRTRLMDDAISTFDVLVYCKAYERVQYEALGKPVVYMPLGYCDISHRPLPSDEPIWKTAVGFVGGWEPRREQLLQTVVASGAQLKIRGTAWDFLRDGRWTLRRYLILKQLAGGEPFRIQRNPILASTLEGGEVYGDDYARALTGAEIGVGFLRTSWPDQHTTRTFEIPACGSMLLADRTEEHLNFFEESKEAEFFASGEELLDKTRFYMANEAARMRLAFAGHDRCRTGRYAYIHRLSDALNQIEKS